MSREIHVQPRLVPPRPRRAGRFSLLFALVFAGGLLPPAAAQAPAADRLLREAERLIAAGDPAAARRELDLLVERFAADRAARRGLLHLAELHRASGDRTALDLVAERLLADHPGSEEAAESLLLAADLAAADARSSADLAAAQSAFRRVVLLFGRESHPRLEARRQARVRSGELALLLGDPLAAAAELLAAVEDEPPGPAGAGARLGLGRAFLALGEEAAAVEVLEGVAAIDAATAVAGERPRVDAARRQALALLSLYHRRVLRPRAGQETFLRAERFPAAGLELREPSGVAATDDGRVVAVDADLPLLVALDADGRETGRAVLEGMVKPGFGRDGRPFVTAENGVVLPFAGTSWAFSDPRRNASLRNLLAAVPGTFGDWLIAAKGVRGALHVADPSGARPPRELLAEERVEIVDMARDAQGYFYLLDEREGRVLRFDREGHQGGVFAAAGCKRATAIDVDALGHVYVLDRGERQVVLLGASGRRLAAVGPLLPGGIELRNPVDLAVDGGGRVFVADTKLPFLVRLD